MKKLLIAFLVLGFAVSVSAVEVVEVEKVDTVEITVIFTKEKFDVFMLDKADPKEWVRNACQVNVSRQEEFIKKDLLNNMVMPTDENVKAKVEEKKQKRNIDLEEQGSGVIYE